MSAKGHSIADITWVHDELGIGPSELIKALEKAMSGPGLDTKEVAARGLFNL